MKLLTKEVCPHCKKDFPSEHELENLEPAIPKGKIEKIEGSQILEPPKQEVKEVIKEITKIPSNIPAYKCKDGKCGKSHKNPNYTKQPKGKCSNCGQFSSNLDDNCLWCNQKDFEEIEQDDLEEMGIEKPNEEEEHDHESL